MINITPVNTYQPASCCCMMIVRDAAKTINQSLNSAIMSGLFNDIIIIYDTRTRDTTRTILDEYERRNLVKVIPYTWERNDFAAARNKALKFCQAQYGFWMDADDILLDAEGIRSLLRFPGGCAYHFWVLSPIVDGGYSTIHQLRLFPIVPGVKWELPAHEQVAFSIQELGIKEIISPYRIYHLGYKDSRSRITRHHKAYMSIMGNWLSINRNKTRQREYLKKQYEASKRYMKSTGKGEYK